MTFDRREDDKMAASFSQLTSDYITVSMALSVIIASIMIWFVLKWIKPLKDTERYPPSPPRLPLLGNLHRLLRGKDFLTVIEELRQEYGPIFTFWIGKKPVVILANQKLIREAFVVLGNATSGRFEGSILGESSSRGGKGIALARPTKQHAANRKFGSSSLQELFNSKNEITSKLLDQECMRLIHTMKHAGHNGQPFNVRGMFYNLTMRMICGACLGPSFIKSEDNIVAVKSFVDLFFQALRIPVSMTVSALPFLQHVPLFNLNAVKLHRKERDVLLEREFRKHRALLATPDYKECCLVDKLLSAGESEFNEDDSIVLIHDLIIAGSETVSTTLYWAMFCLITYPCWQERLQAEVDANVSTASKLRTSESGSFPKLRAFIYEVQRWSSAVPTSLGHMNMEDIVLSGYRIPKKTRFFASLRSLHRDDEQWANPTQFDPDRFLDDNGSFTSPNKSFLPFSIGPRSCPGDRLAKRELFFTLLYILYYINIHPEAKNDPPPFGFVECSTLQPKPFNIRVSSRVPFTE